jgi:hypothetical protein
MSGLSGLNVISQSSLHFLMFERSELIMSCKFCRSLLECPRDVLSDLTFIRPLVEYSCEVWDNCSQRDNDRLEKLELEAGRIVTALTVYSSRESLYQETG